MDGWREREDGWMDGRRERESMTNCSRDGRERAFEDCAERKVRNERKREVRPFYSHSEESESDWSVYAPPPSYAPPLDTPSLSQQHFWF